MLSAYIYYAIIRLLFVFVNLPNICSLLALVSCANKRSLLVCNQDTNICIFFVSLFSLKIFLSLIFWGVCFFIGCKTGRGKVRVARAYPGKILLRPHSNHYLTSISSYAILTLALDV